MIGLQPITSEYFEEVLEFKASEEFVASNAYSLAEAYCDLKEAVENREQYSQHRYSIPFAIADYVKSKPHGYEVKYIYFARLVKNIKHFVLNRYILAACEIVLVRMFLVRRIRWDIFGKTNRAPGS